MTTVTIIERDMIMKMKKTLIKTIAFVLSFSLVFTMAVPSFAETSLDEPDPQPTKVYSQGYCPAGDFNYLCFGDSMTNGYGLPGYDDPTLGEKNPSKHEGFNYVVNGMYPDLVAKCLNEKYGYKVNLFQYAFTATRLEDVLALISTDDTGDPNYYGGDAFTEYYIIEKRIDKLYGEEAGETNADRFGYAKKAIQAGVKKADLITVCLGMNTFVCFLRDRLNEWSDGALGSDRTGMGAYHLNTVLSPEANALYEKLEQALRTVLKKQLGNDAGDIIETICEMLNDQIYAFASYGESYKKFANRIYELNPKADLILIGFPYGAKEVYASMDVPIGKRTVSLSLNLGKIVEALFDVINVYIYGRSASYQGYSAYVDYGDVDLIFENIAGLKSRDKIVFSENYESIVLNGATEDMMRKIGSKIAGEIAGESSGQVKEFDKDNIVNGVAYVQNGTAEYQNCKLVGSVYLAIRDVIIDLLGYNKTNKYNHVNFEKMLPYILSPEDSLGKLFDDTVIAELKQAYSKADGSLREKISEVLKTDGIRDFIFFYARTFMGNGHAAHTSLTGHQDESKKIMAAYDKLQKKKKAERVVKKAVPVIVGGVTVALIASSVVKNMNGGSYSSLSPDGASGDAAVPAGMTGDVAQGNTFSAKIAAVVNNVKEFFSGIAEKIKQGKTYEFQYQ